MVAELGLMFTEHLYGLPPSLRSPLGGGYPLSHFTEAGWNPQVGRDAWLPQSLEQETRKTLNTVAVLPALPFVLDAPSFSEELLAPLCKPACSICPVTWH